MAKFTKDNQPKARGRSKGSVNKTTQLLRDATPEILESLITKAKDGDIQAAQLILKHSLPALKPEYTPINISIDDSMSWLEKAQAVANKALNGECCPSVATQMINTIGTITNAHTVDKRLEVDEHNKGIDKLFGNILP